MATLGDHFANSIRAERARQRITQVTLAGRIGWSTSTLADVEAGRRAVRLDDVPLVCRALGLPLAELVRGADSDDLAVTGLG